MFRFLLIFMSAIPAAMAEADVTTECPDEQIPGAVINIKCLINTTAVSGERCSEDPSTVSFTFISSIGKSDPLCTTPYPGICTVNKSMNSGCISSSGEINTYLCSFVANETVHSGGSITCTQNCGAVPPLTTSATKGCQNIKILRGSASNVTGSESSVYRGKIAVTLGVVIVILIRLSLD